MAGNGKSAWGIYKQHDGVGFLRRVNTKTGDRFGPCSPEQACAHEMILDDRDARRQPGRHRGNGQDADCPALGLRDVPQRQGLAIEVYRLNAEAGRELGFLPGDVGEKMAPWAKPIIDNLDFIMRRLHPPSRWSNPLADQHAEEARGVASDGREPAADPGARDRSINYLRGRSIHDSAIVVDDGQNLTQEDMKLVLTRAGEGSRVILTGDPDQIDRAEINSLSNGLVQVVERFKGEPCFAHLTMQEVVRSRIAELAAKLL